MKRLMKKYAYAIEKLLLNISNEVDLVQEQIVFETQASRSRKFLLYGVDQSGIYCINVVREFFGAKGDLRFMMKF